MFGIRICPEMYNFRVVNTNSDLAQTIDHWRQNASSW
jgi:hypothetical protein